MVREGGVLVVALLLCVVAVWGQGENCPQGPCAESCWFHGRCDESTGTCECDFGYTGPNCLEKTCEDCKFGTCGPDGSCSCHEGYFGKNCDVLLGVQPYTGPVCNLVGQCICSENGKECGEGYGPDLHADKKQLQPYVEYKHFDDCDCAVGDCVGGSGLRKLLRFTMMTRNDGNADLFIGSPGDYVNVEGYYRWHVCHGHPHFLPWQEFRLYEPNLGLNVSSTKSGSTVIDSTRHSRSGYSRRKYIDYRQGLQKGWSDWYPNYLDCQWIDITDLPPGDWVLEVEANPERLIVETNYANNVVTLPLTCKKKCSNGKCDFGSGCLCDEGFYGPSCDMREEFATCVPDCDGKSCGPDGCGGICGRCERHQHCNSKEGSCECTPRCEGKFCGSDSCGGTCGVCLKSTGETCRAGNCFCSPNCRGKQCGWDGCTGLCGTCESTEECVNYVCVPKIG